MKSDTEEFVAMVARLKTESEYDDEGGCMSGDDAVATLSNLIDQARDLLKPNPYAGNCPRCGGLMPNARHPGQYIGALSRWDNKTYVCSDCGEEEALLQWAAYEENPRMASRPAIQQVVHPIHGKVLWKDIPESIVEE